MKFGNGSCGEIQSEQSQRVSESRWCRTRRIRSIVERQGYGQITGANDRVRVEGGQGLFHRQRGAMLLRRGGATSGKGDTQLRAVPAGTERTVCAQLSQRTRYSSAKKFCTNDSFGEAFVISGESHRNFEFQEVGATFCAGEQLAIQNSLKFILNSPCLFRCQFSRFVVAIS